MINQSFIDYEKYSVFNVKHIVNCHSKAKCFNKYSCCAMHKKRLSLTGGFGKMGTVATKLLRKFSYLVLICLLHPPPLVWI